MSNHADLLMVDAFVKAHGQVPVKPQNPLDVALSIWLGSKIADAKKKGRIKNVLSPECLKILQDNNLVQEFTNLVKPHSHVNSAKSLVAYITSRDCNTKSEDFNLWKTQRNWYYAIAQRSDVQPKVKNTFVEAGFEGLEAAKLTSSDLRQLVIANKIVRWSAANKRQPKLIGGVSKIEKEWAIFLKKELHPFVIKYLEKNQFSFQTKTIPVPVPVNQHVGVDLSNIVARIEKIEDLLQKITDILETIPIKKRKQSWNLTFPQEKYTKNICESKLKGLANIILNDGKSIIAGIENIMEYPSGSKKYILRYPNKNGTYGRVFYRWSTSSQVKEVTMI